MGRKRRLHGDSASLRGLVGPALTELDLIEALVLHLPAAVIVLDRDLRFLAVNGRAAAINGVRPDEHVGRLLVEVLPDLPAEFVDRLRRVIRHGQALTGIVVEGSTAAAPGRVRRWLGNYYPVHSRSGAVVGLAGVFEEVNDDPAEAGPVDLLVRDRAGMLAVLDTVVMNAPVGVAVVDAELRYQYINAALAAVNGLPVDAHLGRHVQEMVPAMSSTIAPVLRSVVETGVEVRDLEVAGAVPSAQDRLRYWLLSVFPVPGPDGTTAGAAAVASEVTQHKDQSDRMRELQEFTAALSEAGTVAGVSEAVWQQGRRTVGATAAGIALLDPAGRTLHFTANSGQLQEPGDRWADIAVNRDTPIAEVARTRRPLFFPRPQALLDRYPDLRAVRDQTGDQSWAILPLATPGSPAGVLAFAYDRPRNFEEEERRFLHTVSGLCVQALTRARLYEREHQAAHELQRSLLPTRLPDIPGMELAVRYVAADSAEVGGDFYDAVRLDTGAAADATWRLVIGDVSGRGVGAAGTAGLARHTLRALDGRYTPAGALRRLDELLRQGNDPGRFITAVCAALAVQEPRTVLTVSVAGHPPPLVLRHDGRVETVDVRGSLLGVLDKIHVDEVDITLEPGDAVILYTDGVTETRGAQGLFGDDRLAEVVATCAGRTADQIAGGILLAVAEYRRDAPSDDVAILVLRTSTEKTDD